MLYREAWAKTSEPAGFASLPSHLQDSPPFEFSLAANKHDRVHGLVIDNIFYVVWVDPDHALYP